MDIHYIVYLLANFRSKREFTVYLLSIFSKKPRNWEIIIKNLTLGPMWGLNLYVKIMNFLNI